MRYCVVIMTALPPTKGHIDLIEFASHYIEHRAGFHSLTVLVYTPETSPLSGGIKQQIIKKDLQLRGIEATVVSVTQTLPDSPDPSWSAEELRQYNLQWAKNIETVVHGLYGRGAPMENITLIGSEPYIYAVAAAMEGAGLQFEAIPYDIDRTVRTTKATVFRDDPLHKGWRMLSPSSRAFYHKEFVIFGQESVGKTTMTRTLKLPYPYTHVPLSRVHEFARPYLENHAEGPALDFRKMKDIVNGQYALETTAARVLDTPITLYDTDLLSTWGYANLYTEYKDLLPRIERLIRAQKKDHYFLLSDELPFVPDPLRYGGSVRESIRAYWEWVLTRFEVPFTVVSMSDPRKAYAKVEGMMLEMFLSQPGIGYTR